MTNTINTIEAARRTSKLSTGWTLLRDGLPVAWAPLKSTLMASFVPMGGCRYELFNHRTVMMRKV